MNQNGKHISACTWDPRCQEYNNISAVPNYLKLANNIFDLEKFNFVFSRFVFIRPFYIKYFLEV